MGSQRVDTTERLTLSFHFELITLSSAQNPPKPSQLTKNKSPSLILIYKSCLIITSLLYTHTHTHTHTLTHSQTLVVLPLYCFPTISDVSPPRYLLGILYLCLEFSCPSKPHGQFLTFPSGLFLKVTFSVQFSRLVMSDSLQPRGLQHARLPCPSPTPRAYSNSCPLSW